MMATWNNTRDFSLLYGRRHQDDKQLWVCAWKWNNTFVETPTQYVKEISFLCLSLRHWCPSRCCTSQTLKCTSSCHLCYYLDLPGWLLSSVIIVLYNNNSPTFTACSILQSLYSCCSSLTSISLSYPFFFSELLSVVACVHYLNGRSFSVTGFSRIISIC